MAPVAIVVRPLVVVHEHVGGFFSAAPAFAPNLVSQADEREDAVDELRLFLGEHWAKLEGDQVLERVIPEAAAVRELALVIPREDLPRLGAVKTPITFSVIELSAADGARWVIVPQLGHVIYVSKDQLDEFDERVRDEVLRVIVASDLDGAAYLDLLPPLSLELERPLVEVMPERSSGAGQNRSQRVEEQKRQAAAKLLESVGRRLSPSVVDVLHRDVARVRSALDASARASIVLVGPPGAGKSALIRAALRDCERAVFATSGAELVAGQSFVGQLEKRIADVMRAAELLDAVLYFEDLDDLFAGRRGGYEDIAGPMQRWLEQQSVRLLGELTPDQYDRLQHRHVGFFSYVSRIAVEPLTREQTVDVLRALSRAAREAGAPVLDDAAAPLVVDLVERYDPYRALPGKAIALLEELIAQHHAEPRADGSLEIDSDDVFRGFSAKSGVPEFLLRDERSMLIDDVERFFRQRLIGQHAAVRHVAETLCAVKAGLGAQTKPLATFLFIGPTGVGKTELAKALARFLFGSSDRMARFDMSEYADLAAAERLIRGTDREDGVLTRRIREQPFGVLLLDEIEKADAAVFDLLLQVIGEGRLSDAKGRVCHFVNSIIIMTSNLGAQQRRASVGFGSARDEDRAFYLAQVREHFRPEFVNRLDRIVCFDNLSREQIHEVAGLSVTRIAARPGFEHDNLRLSVSERAVARLAEGGFSLAYGARGLRRHLEQALVAPVASTLSALGAEAIGCVLAVLDETEPEDIGPLRAELADASLGHEVARERRDGLVFRVLRRASQRAEIDVAGVIGVSTLRRHVQRWLELSAISEIRERIGEIRAQLLLAAGSKRARKRAPQGAVLGQLAAEVAKLGELLRPLDSAAQELCDIESLMIAALYDGEAPKLLEPEAKAAYRRFCDALVTALLARADEHEITLAIHELDDKRVLERLLVPLLAYLEEQRWQVVVHVDRGDRSEADGWPPLEKRRWGPPRSIADYRAKYGADRSFSNLLLRVKGHAAGAWLSFALGRWRYHLDDGFGEIWLRWAASRFAVKDEDFANPWFEPQPKREVGQRQELCLEFAEDVTKLSPAAGQRVFEDLEPEFVFRRWNEIMFDRIVSVAEGSGEYLPAGE